jgi:MraZ protein
VGRNPPIAVFTGSYPLTIDDKGRLAVPARFRAGIVEEFGSQMVVTMGPQRCLELYPAPVFRKEVEEIQQQGAAHSVQTRVLRQRFIGHAVECEIDKQGRVMLPQVLRTQAGLDGAVVLVGNIDRFELWSESAWNAMWSDGPGSKLAELDQAFQVLNR